MMDFIIDHTIAAPKWKEGNTGFGATLLGGDPACLFGNWGLSCFLLSLRDDKI